MRIVALVLLLASAASAGQSAVWYERDGFRFAIEHVGVEADNNTAWACGGTHRLQQTYVVRFRSSARGHCGPNTVKALDWSAGQEGAATLPCEGAEVVWKQFRGAKGENPSEFLYGHPTGVEIGDYFDAACRRN